MTVKGKTKERRNDWQALEAQFMDSPWLSSADFAREHDLNEFTVRTYTKPASPDGWEQRRAERYKKLFQANADRIADILEESSTDDVSSFIALETRVKRLTLASLELIIPPAEAPLEAQTAARTRLEAMSAKQLSEIINQSLRTLTETGRHRRLLLGQSTAIYERALPPGEDLYLPSSLEEAQALEMQSRRAQIALRQFADPNSLDVDFAVLPSPDESAPVSPLPTDSPESACPRVVSPNPPASPMSHNAPDTVVGVGCVTSERQAGDNDLGGL
jgi:hypothetical protein